MSSCSVRIHNAYNNKQRFDCVDIGALIEYVGCKIERTSKGLKITQPVILQSFEDEFKIVPKAYMSSKCAPIY